MKLLTLFFGFLIISPHCLHAAFTTPWGKDAELVIVKKECRCLPQEQEGRSLLVPISEVLIKFHQEVISPADGPRSHYKPSSSQYAMDAIHKYGFFQGVAIGCDRLMRENNEDWIYPMVMTPEGPYKWDPVK
jgi:hypothetical protein